ncbi:transposase family protein [Streptomyces prasinus]
MSSAHRWKRAIGAGAKHRLVFVDRLLATLVHLRRGVTHDVPACWFGVDRSTITRAIGEVRPLLAERGCTVSPGLRLRTLAEVVGHLGSSGRIGIIDGTEIRVRRPAAGRTDRDTFISGKSRQNAVKTMVVTDGDGQVLYCSPTGLDRYLRTTPVGKLRIDTAKIKAEENLGGKYLLRCSDPRLSAEDIALGYKQLLEVERGWRDMKQIIALEPAPR